RAPPPPRRGVRGRHAGPDLRGGDHRADPLRDHADRGRDRAPAPAGERAGNDRRDGGGGDRGAARRGDHAHRVACGRGCAAGLHPRRDRPELPRPQPPGVRRHIDRAPGVADRRHHHRSKRGVGMVTLAHYLVLSALVFALGLFAVLTRRNGVAVLMGIELMLNAANINLVAFNKYAAPGAMPGQVFALVVITLAACEAAVGLALVLAAYRSLETIYLDEINLMKW